MRRVLVPTIVAVAACALPAYAQASDPRAKEATDLFAAFCVETRGSRERALAVIGDGNPIANRLPDDLVRQAQGGVEGGVAWAIRSPSNGELVLDYEPRGICGVRIVEADERSVVDAFEQAARTAAASAGAEPVAQPAEPRTEDGVRVTYRAYNYPLDGRTAHLAITTAERRVGAQQHFMTFGFVK